MGEIEALDQIRKDAETLDSQVLAIGPFARLDASAVAARDGKTRGAITNLFGSQAAFQAETMALALSVGDWIDELEYPEPNDFTSADDWFDALLASESTRGPQRGADPTGSYANLWTLWLSAVPYGMWSDQISGPSMEEHVQWVSKLEELLDDAAEHFDLTPREGATIADLAVAVASLTEGVWLNQCLTTRHPTRPDEPVANALRRSGRLLWRGVFERRD